jgi:superfamily I DNA/RNA helicase
MGRKKKVTDDFTPSKYQSAIFDQILHGNGHIVVEAAAGAGKTTTLVKCLELIPEDKQVLMTAFNRDIVTELQKKTKKFSNVLVKTLHGVGLAMLNKNFPGQIGGKPDEYKYISHIRNNIKDYTTINLRRMPSKDYFRYINNVAKYVDFGRYYLCQTEKDLDFIEARYGIETFADEKAVAIKVMEWGKHVLDHIDYVDMIWLPNVLFLKPFGLLFDYIMVDECQDMNRAERELVLKCFKMGTRLISVGDTNQMLYSFAGGDPESFNTLKSIPNTVCLPLSISYRCGKNIVEHAKTIVPSIEWNESGGREGKILYDVPLDAVEDGDMILCRNNAPLVQVYNEFLKLGKKAFIRGKEIGNNLKTLVMSMKQEEINVDCRKDGLFVRLYDDLFITRNNIMVRSGIDAQTALKNPLIENKLDTIKALEILSEGINKTEELIKKIDEIFPKGDKGEGIALSTVHKAKGLEANRVYIVCPSLMPSKAAQKDWEIQQETNLMYVAYTRAKDVLGFIDEKDFDDFDATSVKSTSALARIEYQVNRILGKTTKTIINESSARAIIASAKPVEKKISTSSTININSTRAINSFNDIFKNKKKIKIGRR